MKFWPVKIPPPAQLHYTDGGEYDGQLNLRGERHGYGIRTWPDGNKYEGQ